MKQNSDPNESYQSLGWQISFGETNKYGPIVILDAAEELT